MIEDCRQSALRHTGSTQHPLALHQSWGRDDENVIAPPLAAAFKKQRDIKHDDRCSTPSGKSEEALFVGSHHRMDNLLKPRQSFQIREYLSSEQGSIDPALGTRNPGKRRRHQGHRRAAWPQQPMNRTVGVEERNSEPSQRRRGSALAHANRAREAKDDHRAGTKLASMVARNSWVTRTVTSNQTSNPGRP